MEYYFHRIYYFFIVGYFKMTNELKPRKLLMLVSKVMRTNWLYDENNNDLYIIFNHHNGGLALKHCKKEKLENIKKDFDIVTIQNYDLLIKHKNNSEQLSFD